MRSVVKADAFAPSLLLAALSIGLIAAPDWLTRSLVLDHAAIEAGEWWRAWSAHVVHFSPRHALLDAGTVLLMGRVAENVLGKRAVAMTLLLGAPFMSVAMLLMLPNTAEYRGASGLAALVGMTAGVGLWNSRPRFRVLTACSGILFLAKLASDAVGIPMTLTNLPTDVSIAWQAHLIGAALGIAASILMHKLHYPAQHAASVRDDG